MVILKKLLISLFALLAYFDLFSQRGKYLLKVKVDSFETFEHSCYLKIGDRRFEIREVAKPEVLFSLDSLIAFPQSMEITSFINCSKEDVRILKSQGVLHSDHPHISLFVSEGLNTILVKRDTIIWLNPNDLQIKFLKIEKELDDRIDVFNLSIGRALRRAYDSSSIESEKDSIKNLDDRLFRTEVARLNLDSTLMPAIENNLENAISLYSMDKYIFQARALNYKLPVNRLLMLLKAMSDKVKRYPLWRELSGIVKAFPPSPSLVGKLAPEFVGLTDTSGREVHLKDFKGKVIFLDFWASWCGPCMAQVPRLQCLYKNLLGRDVVFIGVSQDYSFADWKDEIISSRLNWVNVTDLKMNKSITGAAYNISTIPHNFLIDKRGEVVDENVTLDSLTIKIQNLLK